MTKRPFVLADIDPVIAVAEAARWDRETVVERHPEPLFAHDMMKQARVERSAYQRELIRRFAESVLSLFASPHHAVAKAQLHTRRSTGTRSV